MDSKVILITKTENAVNTIASAARLCYSDSDIESLLNKYDDESNFKFINMLMGINHQSPLEHVSFTFGIEGVSRSLTHQLVRHRLASYSQQSQRYVKMDKEEMPIITPSIINSDADIKKVYDDCMKTIHDSYNKLCTMIENKYKEVYSDYNDNRNNYKKKAIEDARYVLPNAVETKIIVSMNVRQLIHFFEERCCMRAQWEIRDMANKMLLICREELPIIFNSVGPKCFRQRKCPEGKMTCGMYKEILNLYSKNNFNL